MRGRVQFGFTYLMLLWWVAISGVILAALGQQWMTETRRQKEVELVFRAEQITAAIRAYGEATPGGVKALPKTMADLLEDRRGPVLRRHLRQWWPDPITGSKEWGLIRSGPYLAGVYSLSTQKPLRETAAKRSYQEWRFVASAAPPSAASSTPLPDAASAPSLFVSPAMQASEPQ